MLFVTFYLILIPNFNIIITYVVRTWPLAFVSLFACGEMVALTQVYPRRPMQTSHDVSNSGRNVERKHSKFTFHRIKRKHMSCRYFIYIVSTQWINLQ